MFVATLYRLVELSGIRLRNVTVPCSQYATWKQTLYDVQLELGAKCSKECCYDVGSTTAEGACESVRLACQQLVQNTLAPTAADLQEEVQNQDSAEATWKAIVKAASNPMAFPNKQLTAYALFDGSRRDKPAGGNVHGLLLFCPDRHTWDTVGTCRHSMCGLAHY